MTTVLRALVALAYLLLAAGFLYVASDWGLETSARLVALAVVASCLHTAWRACP